MANSYVISTITAVGDTVTVTGSVNGIPVSVNCWLSALTGLGSAAAVRNLIAPIMLNAAGLNVGTTVANATVVAAEGSFSQ